MPAEEFSKLTKMFIGRRKSSFITRKFLGKPKKLFSACGISFSVYAINVCSPEKYFSVREKLFFVPKKIEVVRNDKAPNGYWIGASKLALTVKASFDAPQGSLLNHQRRYIETIENGFKQGGFLAQFNPCHLSKYSIAFKRSRVGDDVHSVELSRSCLSKHERLKFQ
jgi:hypothetical protein